jgi:hypothetical protein
MKTPVRLGAEVYADLTVAMSAGTLCHYGLELSPFTGTDACGRVRFEIGLNMHLPAFVDWGATHLSICVPQNIAGNRAERGEEACVVELAPLQYGGEPFTTSFYVKQQPSTRVHPMLQHDQVVRFLYPYEIAVFHEWILAFCLFGLDDA